MNKRNNVIHGESSAKYLKAPSLKLASPSSDDNRTQVITLLKALWRSNTQVHQIGCLNIDKKQFKNIPVKEIKDAISKAFANSDAGLESYFAIAEYITPNSRIAANVSGVYCFWADLDCSETKAAANKGYLKEEAAEKELKEFCKACGLPEPTHIVLSGGGLHVYWALSDLVDRETWLAYALKLKALTKSLGFLADDTRTADIASVLRVPGTLNHKYNPPRLVTLKYAADKLIPKAMMLDAIDYAYNRFSGASAINKPSDISNIKIASTPLVEIPANINRVKSALATINPECDRDKWMKICFALRSLNWECGEQIARSWSMGEFSNADVTKYDSHEFETLWKSSKPDAGISIGTLFHFAKQDGWVGNGSYSKDEFDICETTVIQPKQQFQDKSRGTRESILKYLLQGDTLESLGRTAEIEANIVNAVSDTKPIIQSAPEAKQAAIKPAPKPNPLDKFSLRGRSAELEKNALAEVFVLDGIALMGEITGLFAAPNIGKTVISLRLLVNAIKEGRVDPNKVYYLNMDDSGKGVIMKNRIVEEYNFHMLTEGFEGFSAKEFLSIVRGMNQNNQAHGVIIILDTLKKFTDVMDNTKSSIFTTVMRDFAMKGGTVIALAHTNKNAGKDGKPVYGGVSSILNDIDCAFTIAQVSASNGEKIVEFNNIKRRGNVVQNAAYSYSIGNNIPYDELLLSVQSVDEAQLGAIKSAEEFKSDADVIQVASACINAGINTKMKLAFAVAERAGISQGNAIKLIEKYTGTDAAIHKWKYSVGERGAKIFSLLT